MSRSIHSILQLVFIGALFICAISWVRTNNVILQLGSTGVMAGLLLYFLFLRPAKETLPDHLAKFRNIFEREGICFAIEGMVRDGVFYIVLHYQNHQDQACAGRFVIQWAPGFLGVTPLFPTLVVPIRAGGGEYGVARVPMGVARSFWGKKATMHLSANVHYPNGRGARLRNREGLELDSVLARWDGVRNFLEKIGFCVAVRYQRIALPSDVKEILSTDMPIEYEILDECSTVSSGFEVIVNKKYETEKPTE